MDSESPGLVRSIRFPQALALVVGIVVGVAIFVQPAEVARGAGSPAALLGVWLAAGLLALAGALVCAELAATVRSGGGILAYLSEAFGPGVGFLWGWALFWTIHTSIVGAIATVFARSARSLLPALALDERLLAIGAIGALTALNVAGVRRSAAVQSGLTALKVCALLLLAVAGIAWGDVGFAASAETVREAGPDDALDATGATGLGSALIAALFTFGGWHLVTFPTDETAAPERTLPRALVAGLLVVTALYLALNVAYLAVLPFPLLAASPHVAADAAEALAGPAGRRLVAALATLSALGALAGVVLAGPRVWFALAANGHAPRWLARVHVRHRTPHRALLLQASWASLLVAFGSYRALYSRALVVEWLFFALLGLAAIRLRRRRLPRRFSMPAYPLLPLLFSALSLALVADRLVADPHGSGLGFLFVALGVPFYLAGRRRTRTAAVPATPLPDARP